MDITPARGHLPPHVGRGAPRPGTGVHRPLLGDVLIFEEPSLLAPGCLERLLEAMVGRIEEAVENQVADYRRK